MDVDFTAAPPRRLVIVAVGQFDARTTRILEYSSRIPARERRALHVATDESELWQLGGSWMASGLRLPLHTVEKDGSVAATIAKVIELELDSGYDEVILVIGRLGLRRRIYKLLHDRTADAIAKAVGPIPKAAVAVMTVATV